MSARLRMFYDNLKVSTSAFRSTRDFLVGFCFPYASYRQARRLKSNKTLADVPKVYRFKAQLIACYFDVLFSTRMS